MKARTLKPLAVMILALLREEDMHPYEMMRLLRMRRDDRFFAIRNGTFYHQVSVLERDGYIAEVGIDRDGNRPERTTYTLLESGHSAVADWVRDRLPRTDSVNDFRIALSEAHNLDSAEARELLLQRVAALQCELGQLRGAYTRARAIPVDRQFLIEVERAMAIADVDIAWTLRICDELAAGELPWGQPSADHVRRTTDDGIWDDIPAP